MALRSSSCDNNQATVVPDFDEGIEEHDRKVDARAAVVPDFGEGIEEHDRKVDAYTEIENLWHVRQSAPHNLALEQWQRKEEELDKRASRREGKSQDLHTQIHNIIGWYAVFQGVLLTAVTQMTQTAGAGKPLCGKIWFPLVLTSFGTLVTIVGVVRLFQELKKLDRTINTEQKSKAELVSRANTLLRLGPKKFSFKIHAHNGKKYPDPGFLWEWISAILALIIFTVLFILSYFVILCDKWVIAAWN